ncbi:MAG: hypothetical protein LPK15_15235 [Alteromonadaceae bacterium]|uniref:hypothetical protein n=1 Tax=Marinobacter sp. TaxID=50741 RepID=UPI0029C29E4F|nr:hypothetical protein [Marinobacter sp.]MDX5388110.1 hypothetical protein [Marinobacter sp.]MDX5441788.1 hypothetical protein [Alteromonadaceae bacterium]
MNAQSLYRKAKAAPVLMFAALSAVAFHINAAPTVSGAVLGEDSSTLTIVGTGFGQKPQAAPILLDKLDTSYENGAVNSAYQILEHGDKVPTASESNFSIWAAGSSGAWESVRPAVTSSHQPRHDESKEHYFLRGQNSTLGNPVAHGGQTGWNTPTDDKQLYVSWWYKPKFPPQRYWRISPVSLTGEYIPGEPLNIGGIAKATFIGIDSDGQLNLAFNEKPPTTKELLGSTIVGIESGAKSLFPDQHISASSIGYESPGSQKYIRVWEDPAGKEGIRFSWTQMHQTIGTTVNWAEAPLQGGKWNHLELELDTQKGFARLHVNSKKLTEFSFDPALDREGKWSPTVALIGLEGKVGRLQESHLDDIYIDNTLQRVVLANAKSINDATHYEVQQPVKWDDQSITVIIHKGAIPDISAYYIFVFDDQGNPNKEGYPICGDCKLPPAKIDLSIE